MTSKEKAKELVDEFKKATTFKYQEYAGANYSTFEHDGETIKECAVIAATVGYGESKSEKEMKYWKDVIVEINAL